MRGSTTDYARFGGSGPADETQQVDCDALEIENEKSMLEGDKARPGQASEENGYSVLHQCMAEAWGTFLLVLFGLGSVSSATLGHDKAHSTQVGLWQVAVVWGYGVALSVYTTASISGAHLNPSVTLAFAITRPKSFSWKKVLPFWAAQFLGAFLAGLVNLIIYYPMILRGEESTGIVRGTPESVLSASCFGEYYPNPGTFPGGDFISPAFALLVEAWGTFVLAFIIFALTHSTQSAVGPHKELVPLIIGLSVAVLVSLYAPITQAGLNPARDFGPRLVAAMAGWGKAAIPGPKNGFWIYIAGPLIGAPLGGLFHDFVFIGLFSKKRTA